MWYGDVMLEVRDLSNEGLLNGLKSLLRKDANLEADLLVFLGEVDFRRLYPNEACSSMFVYCAEVLQSCQYSRKGLYRDDLSAES